jgi:protoporphyrinogen oxidase
MEEMGVVAWGPTRREILAALLGVPAMAACDRPAPSLPSGEIVGASDGIGHRIRDGLRIDPPRDNRHRAGVVIVGGGVAGLSAAWRLLRSGYEDFVVVELEREPGGTSRSGQTRLVAYPWGAHYLPAPLKENRALITLLDEMSILEGADQEGQPVVAEQFLCREPEERLYYRGYWYEGLYLYAGASPEDNAQREAFAAEVNRWVDWRDRRGRRAFGIPIDSCSDDPEVTELDGITMGEWLDGRGLTSPRLRWWVDYGCRDDYGTTLDQTSAWAGLFYHASRVAKAGEESRPLITWPEGNGRLVSHLSRTAGARVRTGLAVTSVEPSPGGRSGVRVIAVGHDGTSATGFDVERVIFAAPHFLKRYVIQSWSDNQPSGQDDFRYSAWMVANLFLKDRPLSRGFPLAWDNVFYESPSLGYVVATHQRGLDHGPTVFTYYYPLCDTDDRAARSRLLAMSRDECADVAMSDLRRAHRDIDSLVERLDVMKWGHAMISPRPGFIWGRSRAAAARQYRGIHFAHSDLSGIAIFEEAFYHGIRAAEEVLAAMGRLDRKMT